MAFKANVVRAINQQFTGRIAEITDAVMARITDSNAGDILGPELAALMGRGSIKSIVTFALYADALRVVRDVVVVDGVVSDDEIRDGLGILSVVIAAFAKVRSEYASYTPPSLENARNFLSHYQSDAGLFGYRNDATRWAGRALCRNIEATCKDSKPAVLLSEALMQWAEQIAAADGASPAEIELLGSLARVLDIPAASRNATGVTPEQRCTDGQPHDPATLSPPPKEVPPVRAVSTASVDRPTKDCPFCGEAILAVAIKCKHCGEMLGDARPTAEPHALHHGSSTADRLKSADVTYPEIKRTCKKCGKVWFSDSEEEAWLEQSASTGHAIAGLQSLSAAFSGYGRAGGFNSVDSHQRNRMEAQPDDDKLGTMRRCPECLSRAYEEVKPPKPAYSGLPSQLSAEQRAVLYEIGMAKDTADTIEPERNQLFEQQFADYTNGKKTFRKLGHIVRKAFLSRVVQVLLVVIGAGALYIYFWPRTLTPATARRLASRFAPLQLDYVKELTPATAGELSRHTYGELSLDGLRTLTLDVATALAQKRYGPLSLDGLSSISPDIARALANHERDLSLNGLQDISSEVAEALATLEGGLFLDGLKEVSPEVAMALAAHRGELSLQGVSTISNDVAEALADHANQHGAGYPYGLRLQSAVDEMVGKAAERAKGTEKPNRPEPESVRQLRENFEFEYRLQQSKGGIWPPLR